MGVHSNRRFLSVAVRGGLSVSALALAVAVAVHVAPAVAQEGGAAVGTQATITFDIPSQDLNAALLSFADRAGVQVFYDASLLAGLRSAPLSGRYTTEGGLAQLLRGTGLTHRFTGPNAVSLERPAVGEGAAVLSPVVVDAPRRVETARGPVEGYVATRSATATKTDTPILRTPQAINVVTREQMEDQGVQSVTGSLRYTPGVVAQYGDNDVRHDWLTVRGFTPARYRDGLRLPFGARGYSQPRVETYGLERVEVLKGPSSVMFGQGTPGGTVNMVSKRPTDEALHEIQLQTGSHARMQGAFDLSGRLDENGDVLGRVVALGRKSDTQFDHVDEEKVFVAPSLTLRPRDDTEITLLGEYQRIDSDGGGGAPALPANGTLFTDLYPELPTDTFVGEPGFDRFTNTQWFVGYEATHEVNDTWSLRQNFRHGAVDTDTRRVQAFCSGPCDPSALLRYAWAFPESSTLTTVDTQATAAFETGAVAHTALFGVDYSYEDSRFEESQLQLLTMPFNAYDPAYGQVTPTRPPAGLLIDQTRSRLGVYAQDQLTYGGFDLIFGGRYDWVDSDTDTTRGGTTQTVEQTDRAFTGRAGLVYTFDTGIAPYLSYSTSFDPASGTDRTGAAFDPTEGEQYEVGVKFQPPGSESLVTLSAYQLTQKNVLTPDPVNTSFRVQTGEVRLRGIELEGKAQVTDELSLIASYAYTHSEITKDNPNAAGLSNEGNHFAFVPTHQASAWADYEISTGPAQGLGLGAGVRWASATYGDNANAFHIDGTTLVDAGIRYDLGGLTPQLAGAELSLDVQNVFDTDYVSTCLSATGCYYGTGRTVFATLTYAW